MAKKNIASHAVEMLSYEEQVQQLPEFPTRPALYPEDFPSGELASMAQAHFQMERYEREHQQRAFLSGHNATPWASCGAQTPQEIELELERQQDVRRYMNGLPDSSDENPVRTRAGKPF